MAAGFWAFYHLLLMGTGEVQLPCPLFSMISALQYMESGYHISDFPLGFGTR
jgi:hypothetical protein